jgi:hypothetical protein
MLSHALPEALSASAPGRWFRDRLDLHDVELRVDDQLRAPVAADRPSRTIWVPEGCGFRHAYLSAAVALLYIQGGSEWAPEFAAPPPEWSAIVLPFQRHAT